MRVEIFTQLKYSENNFLACPVLSWLIQVYINSCLLHSQIQDSVGEATQSPHNLALNW